MTTHRATAFLFLACCLPHLSSAQVMDGSITPNIFSDRHAAGVLFTVIRTRPSPAWDLDTRLRFLQEKGLRREEALALIRVADAWFNEIAPLDASINELKAHWNGKGIDKAGQAEADQIAARKLALLDSHLAEFRLGLSAEGNNRVSAALQQVKRGMKAYLVGTLPPPPANPHH
jgi:hypothetical protein